MNWKRVIVFILLFPIVIPVLVLIGFIHLFLLTIDGIHFAITGDIPDREDEGW